MMREGKIILPASGNNGLDISAAHDILRRDLIHSFGGYTSFTGRGAWMDGGKLYDEEVVIYTVATDVRLTKNSSNTALLHIAENAGRMAKQLSVYLCDFDGVATIRDLSHSSARAAA